MSAITENADRHALLLMVSFKTLLIDLIEQHQRLPNGVIYNVLMGVACEFLASAHLPQRFAPDLPEGLSGDYAEQPRQAP
jgi:hypothetical protein